MLEGVVPRLQVVGPRLELPSAETIASYPRPDFSRLVDDEDVRRILDARWDEAKKCFSAGAYLATIIALGSLLEGVLLSRAMKSPIQAKAAPAAPKRDQIPDWSLADLIRVAHECGWI